MRRGESPKKSRCRSVRQLRVAAVRRRGKRGRLAPPAAREVARTQRSGAERRTCARPGSTDASRRSARAFRLDGHAPNVSAHPKACACRTALLAGRGDPVAIGIRAPFARLRRGHDSAPLLYVRACSWSGLQIELVRRHTANMRPRGPLTTFGFETEPLPLLNPLPVRHDEPTGM